MTKIIREIVEMLQSFRPLFKRVEAFEWFQITILGMLIRNDTAGVASIMRACGIEENRYEALLHFFYSNAYDRKEVETAWIDYLSRAAPFPKLNNRLVMIGDHTKAVFSGKNMPGVEKLADYSQDSTATYQFAQFYGYTGIVVGRGDNLSCIPVKAEIQNALGELDSWTGSDEPAHKAPNTTQMIRLIHSAATRFGPCVCGLDRAFLCKNTLKTLYELNNKAIASGKTTVNTVELVTRAKNGVIAHGPPPPPTGKKGRPTKYGKRYDLFAEFNNPSREFKKYTIPDPKDPRDVEYCMLDLYWGRGVQYKLRFVLVKSEKKGNLVLVCTDLTMSPEDIILCYHYRWKIETMFRELKSEMGVFSYRFWTKAIPKLDRFAPSDAPDRLSQVAEDDRQLVLNTVEAYERYVLFTNIALSMIILVCADPVNSKVIIEDVFMRTRTHPDFASVAAARCFMRKWYFMMSLLLDTEELRPLIPRMTSR